MLNKSYYEELHLRKDSGEKLYFESITYIELAQLWWDEVISDYEIAKYMRLKRK